MVIEDRSFQDFNVSAEHGCNFCDLIRQSFPLFTKIGQVDLFLYSDSPIEIHSKSNSSEILGIYAESGKYSLPA